MNDELKGPARARAALEAASPPVLPEHAPDPVVVEASTAWAAWDSWPSSLAKSRRLEAALRAIAGDRAGELRRWVNDQVQVGVSRSDAIRAWMGQREENDHG